MSHTNSTPNYNLPQFLTTDKPFWLTDINGAFSDIDTAIDAAKDAADAAQGDATQALTDASTADSKATTADGKASGAIASISDTFSEANTYNEGDYVIYNNLLYKCIAAVTVPGAWTGTTNWDRTTLNSIINNLTGADIEYSSGITVNQELNSKAEASDVPSISTVTLTPNTSIVGSSYIGACYKYGKIACVFIETLAPIAEVQYESILLTGLPIPAFGSNARFAIFDRTTEKAYRFEITNSGELKEWYNSSGKIPAGADLFATLVYVTN